MKRTFTPRATLFLLLILAFALANCNPYEDVKLDGDAIYDHDSSYRDDAQKGIDFKVTEFQWRYNGKLDRVEIDGKVENQTGEDAQQGVRIVCDVYDQHENNLGSPIAFITPTYIPAGGTGRFEVTVTRGDWVKAVRLIYHFEQRN